MTGSIVRRACLALICAGLTVPGLVIPSMAQKIEVGPNNRTIAVTVSGKATAQATIATVHIGFADYAPDSASAYAEGSKTSNAIIDALRQAGVTDKAIQSQGQNLRQNFEFDNNASELQRAQKRYVLTQSWTVKTTATDAAKILHIAVEAGANQSGQIDWDVADRAALEAQAAAQALRHAQALASEMAKGLGVQLGPLLYASNQAPETPVRPMPMMVRMEAAKAAPVKPLAILPQQIVENTTVYAVFSIQ